METHVGPKDRQTCRSLLACRSLCCSVFVSCRSPARCSMCKPRRIASGPSEKSGWLLRCAAAATLLSVGDRRS